MSGTALELDEKPKVRKSPQECGAGRRKGTPNKVTASLQEMIMTALGWAGGAKYLLEQSEKNPVAFMALVGKLIPYQLQHSGKIDFQVNPFILDVDSVHSLDQDSVKTVPNDSQVSSIV